MNDEHDPGEYDYRGCIELGVQYLDKFEPGRLDELDLDMLDLNNCTHCVLGQIGGDYRGYKEVHGFSETWCENHGFSIPMWLLDAYFEDRIEDPMKTLTDEWKKYLRERKAQCSMS